MTSTSKTRAQTTRALTDASLARAVARLAERDAELARVASEFGPPSMWGREPGFASLVRIMLGQQVSLASADATYERLLAAASPLTPAALLALSDETLRRAGFSRQKTVYARHLASLVESGELDFDALKEMTDDEVRAQLLKVKGVGPWTAEIYMLMAMRRPDAWPSGDLALQIAAQELKGLPARPSPAELDALAESWRPLRAVAARLLWSHYLNRPRRRTG